MSTNNKAEWMNTLSEIRAYAEALYAKACDTPNSAKIKGELLERYMVIRGLLTKTEVLAAVLSDRDDAPAEMLEAMKDIQRVAAAATSDLNSSGGHVFPNLTVLKGGLC